MSDDPQFLCVTLYVHDIAELRGFYHEVLGLPLHYEERGHIAAMGRVCVHDPSEGPANTTRLYFTVNDPEAFAHRAEAAGHVGMLRKDGYGNPAWETRDPFGNSVVVLQQVASQPER